MGDFVPCQGNESAESFMIHLAYFGIALSVCIVIGAAAQVRAAKEHMD